MEREGISFPSMRLTALSSTGRWGTKMNSFETDMKRACVSVNFMAGLLLEWLILAFAGSDSELFQISIPVLAALPYSSAWLMDYQSGFIRQYLLRCGKASYILGKFLSCGISGGALPATACFVWEQLGAHLFCFICLLYCMSGIFRRCTACIQLNGLLRVIRGYSVTPEL